MATAAGKDIIVHHPGAGNKSDGPDFTDAEITIGNLRWYGDVEIHWRLSDWNAHNHQHDPNFQNVILHVVFEETQQTIQRPDGSHIPTLCLSPYLSNPLRSFIDQYRSRPQLPCSGQLSFISKEAFQRQLEKAHKEYFEQKVDDILGFYDPSLPPSKAWQKMLVTALFDGLGISHNRVPMQKLAASLFPEVANAQSARQLRQQAVTRSQITSSEKTTPRYRWKRKGCRPGNHPLPRIKQGADTLWHIYHYPMNGWWREDPENLWKKLVNSVTVTPSIGRQRSSILFGTVFLPALYFLGNLFSYEALTNKSWNLWKHHQAKLPDSLLQILHDSPLPASIYAQKLGTIYQLRTYCYKKHCEQCEVFKNVISS